ncbi:dynein axonemal heavy chain 14 isoform X2 [Heliangelus exortis]|uniref:dynein axonemal heavy chain 14 isoform X2 n=1 Tax=Heliangelus exortis TaxID=472823 RepID=UPI003A8EDC18
MDERNKMLKEKLVSRLRFEAEKTEALLMAKGKYTVCELDASSEKSNSETSSQKQCPILRTAVYRGSREKKHKAAIKEEVHGFGNVYELSRMHKEGREESVCQPTSMSEHETVKLQKRVTKRESFTSKNENLKKMLSTDSAYKAFQSGFHTSPSPEYGKVPTMAEVADNITNIEMQTAGLEPSYRDNTCKQSEAERSSEKPLRIRVHSYDKTEPIDDDVIIHIVRLRGKLGWQTKLPSCEWLPREAEVARFQKSTREFSARHKSGEMEATPVPQWLHERQMFYRLLNLRFFSNFRMKKCFQVWKFNVRSKRNKTESVLM